MTTSGSFATLFAMACWPLAALFLRWPVGLWQHSTMASPTRRRCVVALTACWAVARLVAKCVVRTGKLIIKGGHLIFCLGDAIAMLVMALVHYDMPAVPKVLALEDSDVAIYPIDVTCVEFGHRWSWLGTNQYFFRRQCLTCGCKVYTRKMNPF